MKERLVEFLAYLSMGQNKFEEKVGLSRGFVHRLGNNITLKTLKKITDAYPELNENWLKTGEGEMLKPDTDKPNDIIYVPLLPIAAQGGTLNDFIVSIKDSECEKIISPIKGVDFAITVSGDSMAPEYPSGSQVLIKKINEEAFINWGNVFVLDTCNGIIIKKVFPIKDDDASVMCVSINPEFPSFPVKRNSIYGFYRVLLCMATK
jgi:phage repressor protein C with HTH and peptisase S24 domain